MTTTVRPSLISTYVERCVSLSMKAREGAGSLELELLGREQPVWVLGRKPGPSGQSSTLLTTRQSLSRHSPPQSLKLHFLYSLCMSIHACVYMCVCMPECVRVCMSPCVCEVRGQLTGISVLSLCGFREANSGCQTAGTRTSVPSAVSVNLYFVKR